MLALCRRSAITMPIKLPCEFAHQGGSTLDPYILASHPHAMTKATQPPLAPTPVAASGLFGLAMGLLMVAIAVAVSQLSLPVWGAAPTVLLFLPAVLVTARYSGLAPALAMSVLATLSFDYFFTEPYHSLRIESPSDMLTAGTFFLVALVISRLASVMRTQAIEAAERAENQATAADLAQQLITCADRDAVVHAAVTHLARQFDCQALFAIDGERPVIICSRPATVSLAPNEEAALVTSLALGKTAGRGYQRLSQADWQFHPVILAGTIHGAAGLARRDGGPPVPANRKALLESLLEQVALALERVQRDAATHAAIVTRERERFRAGLHASISEDVKPRILAIQSCVKRIKRNAGNKEAASMVATEAAMLQRCVDHLGDNRLASDLEPITCGPLRIDLFRHQVTRDGNLVHLTPKEFAVLSELARNAGSVLTHRQLLRAVWGPAHEDDIDYLRVAIRALRQKLELDPKSPVLIVNEPALGYRLSASAKQFKVIS